jgi:multifunctional beta-oxidation protein
MPVCDSSEGADDFHAIPTFGVIPPFSAETPYDISSLVPNFNPMMLLHGEQYLEIRQYPIPTAATLVSYPQLIEVVDKGGASVVKSGILTVDKETGKDVFWNEMTVFLRGSGGFGGLKKGEDRGAATAANKVPDRPADEIVEEKTTEEQAVLYRLSGDYK